VNSKTIHDSKTAQFFADFTRIGRLEPFMLGECSLAEAAAQLHISKSLMGYWVKIMLELDLIRVVCTEKRGRHHVPIYATTSSTFDVPMDLIPEVSNETWLERNATEFERRAQQSLIRVGRKYADRWQLSCFVTNGVMQVMVLPNGEDSIERESFNRFGNFQLTAVQAAALQLEMMALYEKYNAQKEVDSETKSYLIRYLLVEENLE
jgi:hypothetical protein